MQLGIIGLGRMGGNIARRLKKAGHDVVVFDVDAKAVDKLAGEGLTGASGLEEIVHKLQAPRAIWIMLPSGKITEDTIRTVAGTLSAGDIIIDGGNSFYKDDIRRAAELREKKITYVDVGTSGGVWGLERGYCMMIGGTKEAVDHLDPIFKTLAPGIGSIDKTPGREAFDPRAEHGYIHAGPAGAGHFVKMIHNGIEYGMMQAYAEGFDILKTLAPGIGSIDKTPGREAFDPRAEHGYIHAGPAGAGHFVKMIHNGIEYGMMQAYAEGFDILKNKSSADLPEDQRFTLHLPDIAEVWRRGSVVASWLLDLTSIALAKDEKLSAFSGEVEDSGEGRWTIEAAIEEAVPADVLSASLFARFRSRQKHTFGEKLLSAMRFQFGGHVERK